MKIYIGFSSPIKWKIGSELIKWWTDSEYSHSYLRFEYSDGKNAVFHAAHGMVHFKSEANFFRDNKSLKEYCIEISEKDHNDLFNDCMDLSGEDYSILELAQIFLSDVYFSIFKKEFIFSDQPGYICSELVGALCIRILRLQFSKPTYLLKPKDVDFKLMESNFKTCDFHSLG